MARVGRVRKVVFTLIGLLMAATLACSTVTGALDPRVDPTDVTPTARAGQIQLATAMPSPTPTAIGPIPAGFEQTGQAEADIAGETYTWYTFRSPGVGEAMVNSASWGLRGGPLGSYKGVVALAGGFEGDTPEPVTAIYMEFPFKDEGAPFELEVPAHPLEPTTAILVNLRQADYEMIDGVLTIESVLSDGTRRAMAGTFSGTLALSTSDGGTDESQTIELTAGKFEFEQIESTDGTGG